MHFYWRRWLSRIIRTPKKPARTIGLYGGQMSSVCKKSKKKCFAPKVNPPLCHECKQGLQNAQPHSYFNGNIFLVECILYIVGDISVATQKQCWLPWWVCIGCKYHISISNINIKLFRLSYWQIFDSVSNLIK